MEDAEAYVAENILQRKLDKHLDEKNILPIERCYGIAITGIKYLFEQLGYFDNFSSTN